MWVLQDTTTADVMYIISKFTEIILYIFTRLQYSTFILKHLLPQLFEIFNIQLIVYACMIPE